MSEDAGGFRVCGSVMDWYQLQHHRASRDVSELRRLQDIQSVQCGSLKPNETNRQRNVCVEVHLSEEARNLITKAKQKKEQG
jgi:hypothetical protein